MIRRFALTLVCLAGTAASAQQFSADALIGLWEFTAYAEERDPGERTPVGVLFDFRPNGTLISKMSTGDVESHYSVDGMTIHYSDARGEQTWTVRAFEAGVSLVFENRGTLMYLERR